MRQKPGNISSGAQFNVAAMDTGNPSILYNWRASSGNPFCFFSPPAQTIHLADQAGDKKQLFRAWFCLLCFCALKSLCNRLKKTDHF